MVKAYFYWKITNPEEGQDPFNIVAAHDVTEAIEIYISQYDYLNKYDITRVEQIGCVLIDSEKL